MKNGASLRGHKPHSILMALLTPASRVSKTRSYHETTSYKQQELPPCCPASISAQPLDSHAWRDSLLSRSPYTG